MSDPTHPLQIRDYRLIWLTRFASVSAQVGMVVVIGAQVYQIARQTHAMNPAEAAFLLGLLGLAQFVPFLLLTPLCAGQDRQGDVVYRVIVEPTGAVPATTRWNMTVTISIRPGA